MKKSFLIALALFSVSCLANSATIEPSGTIQAWRVDTPIIPEAHSGKYIENIGNVPIKAILQWKPPFGRYWKEVKDKTFQPGERGNLTSGQAFYHQRLVIENLSKTEKAEVDWRYYH